MDARFKNINTQSVKLRIIGMAIGDSYTNMSKYIEVEMFIKF